MRNGLAGIGRLVKSVNSASTGDMCERNRQHAEVCIHHIMLKYYIRLTPHSHESMCRYYKCLRDEENDECSCQESFIKATARKMKAFPASLYRAGIFRSLSEPSASQLAGSKRRNGSLVVEKAPEVRSLVGFDDAKTKSGDVAINDTLKVIFVVSCLTLSSHFYPPI